MHGILFWFNIIYIIIVGTLLTNLGLILFYIDKRTMFKRDFVNEDNSIKLLMLFFSFFLIFFKKNLRYRREICHYEDRLRQYKICKPVETGYVGDDMFDLKIKEIERYLKLRKLQHKSKNRIL